MAPFESVLSACTAQDSSCKEECAVQGGRLPAGRRLRLPPRTASPVRRWGVCKLVFAYWISRIGCEGAMGRGAMQGPAGGEHTWRQADPKSHGTQTNPSRIHTIPGAPAAQLGSGQRACRRPRLRACASRAPLDAGSHDATGAPGVPRSAAARIAPGRPVPPLTAAPACRARARPCVTAGRPHSSPTLPQSAMAPPFPLCCVAGLASAESVATLAAAACGVATGGDLSLLVERPDFRGRCHVAHWRSHLLPRSGLALAVR